MLSKKLIVVYTQGIFFFMFYLATVVIGQQIENKQIATLLDPFAFQTMKSIVQYWTPVERNTQLIPYAGLLFYNRLLWVVIGGIVGWIGYRRFSFDLSNRKKNVAALQDEPLNPEEVVGLGFPRITIYNGRSATLNRFWQNSKFQLLKILREPIFWVIVGCLIVTILLNSINLGTAYEVDSLPKTYLIVEELQELSVFFFMIILIIYSGELMWESRDARIDAIVDALPIGNFGIMLSKLTAMFLMFLLLLFALIVTGVAFQLSSGYTEFSLSNYLSGLLLGFLPDLMLFTVVSFLFQSVTNHKFLSHLLLVLFVVGVFILTGLGYDHPLISFGGLGLATFSEMNGYGDSIIPFVITKFYWSMIASMLLIVSVLINVRGKSIGLVDRIRNIRKRWAIPIRRLTVAGLMAMMMSGCFIFYNTNILREYSLPQTEEKFRISYEKELKEYERILQPKIVDVKYNIDLFPEDQEYIAAGTFVLENKGDASIGEIHVQKVPSDQIVLDTLYLNVDGVLNYNEEFGYYIYELTTPLELGDSIVLHFIQSYTSEGFGTSPITDIVYNGTFLNGDHFPTLGYNSRFEARDESVRRDNNLPPRKTRASIGDIHELKNGRTGGDGYEIKFEATVSTDSSQMAIAPGQLLEQWSIDDRKYFRYKMNEPMVNFYTIISARYGVLKETWDSTVDSAMSKVQLEIYHHPSHNYNLDRMIHGMKASLDYYTKAFGPYPYKNMRIMEFPRYRMFAQSFPGTIPYSESLGFILDIDDENDVDMAFYVTAHEVAHQWWGLQVIPANVEGRHMIAETLAQYSATMVLQKEHGKAKVKQHLARERERYLTGRTNDDRVETSLARVTSHKYVHYGKGAVNMYALQDYIGEEKVNLALRRFVNDWNAFGENFEQDRYATTDDLIDYFREVTPDSLQYVITDLFEKITLYDNQVKDVSYKEISKNHYEIAMEVQSIKYYVDSLGAESKVSSNDWIDIGIYTLDDNGREELTYLRKHKITSSMHNIKLSTKYQPSRVAIDPGAILIDREKGDNFKKIEDFPM